MGQVLLCGRKRWTFRPLSLRDQISWLGRCDTLDLEVVREDLSKRHRHRIRHTTVFPDPEPCDSEAAAARAVADSLKVEVELHAGEMILVPGGVPHQVINLEDCIAVSRNFIDVTHARHAAMVCRWPKPFEVLADFLEEAAEKELCSPCKRQRTSI